jgi:8-oxo-dGTP diphosphatase
MKHYACAILLDGERLLLGRRALHRRAYANRWDVIGGRVEEGETVEEALRRELAEEIGVIPTTYAPLGAIEDSNPEARGHSLYHMFVVTSWTGGQPMIRDDEHSALEWFTVEEACGLPELALAEYQSVFRSIGLP